VHDAWPGLQDGGRVESALAVGSDAQRAVEGLRDGVQRRSGSACMLE
jgi:hypothetical protein